MTLVCKRVSGGWTADEVYDIAEEFLTPYLIDAQATLYFGFFRLDNGDIIIDVNCLVDAGHRENTLQFAKANGQESIWDGKNQCFILTGGNGISKLRATLEEVEHAAVLLERGFKHPIQHEQNWKTLTPTK